MSAMQLAAVRLADDPRARGGIRRAKGAAGLLAFVLVGLLSRNAGLPGPDAAARALLAGVAGYLLAWGVAVVVWRQLVLAELEAAGERRRARLEAAARERP